MIGYIYYNPKLDKLIEITEEFYIGTTKCYSFVDTLFTWDFNESPGTIDIYGISHINLKTEWVCIGTI